MASSVDCHIYRCKARRGMYVYITERDNFNSIPVELKNKLGVLEFTFSMTLKETRKLVRLDAKQVIRQLKKEGYFLQMPPPNTNFLDLNLRQSDGF